MGTLEIIGEPTDTVPDLESLPSPAGPLEPYGSKIDDTLTAAAHAVGRINVSYEKFWEASRNAPGKWIAIRCNSARRALLLASAALQHRTQPHDVKRRGRVVFIRMMQTSEQKTA